MFEMDLLRTKVVCHPYRTAKVFGARLTFDRNSDECKELVKDLAKKAGVSEDNHVVYSIIPDNGDVPLHLWVTDSHVLIGTKLVEESW